MKKLLSLLLLVFVIAGCSSEPETLEGKVDKFIEDNTLASLKSVKEIDGGLQVWVVRDIKKYDDVDTYTLNSLAAQVIEKYSKDYNNVQVLIDDKYNDTKGNEKEATVIKAGMDKETAASINWENFDPNNLSKVGNYWKHKELY
ncbi:hypothetical protein [Pseudalkalibacillus caeni]|uniref:Lipoprotein n=1 Tax=Exobacillus caeni TaxID=2574798 RepID=A0A5R9F2A7_9BACL|nr:hypothetical protein [Pseudalkalibacillus caeni]TLS37747.1 hypothetical protein FCL54_07965 [Pseudalkalibacillus caeni]